MAKIVQKELNKFERARLLSARAQELAAGAEPKVKIPKKDLAKIVNYTKIAEMEFEKGKLELEVL